MNPEEIKQEPVEKTPVQLTDLEKERSRRLIPLAIGLGLLLIVGGIVFLSSTRNKQVVNLPDYTPDLVTPYSSTAAATPTPTPSTSSVATIIVTSPTPQVAGTQTSGPTNTSRQTSKTSGQTKTKSSPLPQYTPQSELANYQPNSEPLPDYTPNSSLPEYQPQYSGSDTNSNDNNITVSMKITSKNNTVKTYDLTVNKDATVYEVMQAAQSKGLAFTSTYNTTFGSEQIQYINGDGPNWIYCINSMTNCPNRGVSVIKVQAGDQILWKQV